MAWDEVTVRGMLRDAQESLERIEQQREYLEAAIKSFEGWLRFEGRSNGSAPQLPMLVTGANKRTPKGPISYTGAVLKVLKTARGEPLHVKEIHRRATELGGVTNAASPEGVTDLICYSLAKKQPLKKVAPRTWIWRLQLSDAEIPDYRQMRVGGN